MADAEFDEEDILEQYNQLKNEVLIESNQLLVKNLQPLKLLPFLRSKFIFDEEDEQIIKAEITTSRKAQTFLDILTKKGPDAFDYFCEALLKEATGQQHLLRTILEEFDNKRVGSLEPVHIRRPAPKKFIAELPRPGEVGGPMLPMTYTGGSEPPPAYSEYIN